MISRILIPTDFSPASWKATQYGLELSKLSGDSVISFLHVYPLSSKYVDEDNTSEDGSVIGEVKDKMNHISKSFTDQWEEKIENIVLSGNVEEQMLDYIKEHDFDLIIVGINSNGRNNEIGSHTERVIKDCGVPVLIVPNNRTHSGNGAIAS